MSCVDSVGNIILKDDILRVFHFQTNIKKYYMYKKAGERIKTKVGEYIKFYHLGGIGSYIEKIDSCFKNYIVVQRRNFYNDPKIDELKRNKKLSD